MENFAGPLREVSPEIAAEADLLKADQADNADRMSSSGLFDRFFQVPSVAKHRFDTTPTAACLSKQGRFGAETTRYALAIGPLSGRRRDVFRYVTIAEAIDDVLIPRPGFTDEDAQQIQGMIEGLLAAQAAGILSNLSPDCLGIVGAKE